MTRESTVAWSGRSLRWPFFAFVVGTGLLAPLVTGGLAYFTSSRAPLNLTVLATALLFCWVWTRFRHIEVTADGVRGRRGVFLRKFAVPARAVEAVHVEDWTSKVIGSGANLKVRLRGGGVIEANWLRGPGPQGSMGDVLIGRVGSHP